MGKHPTNTQKIEFLTHCEYVSIRVAAKKAGIAPSTAKDIRARAGVLQAHNAENGLPPPIIDEQIARKVGSGSKPLLSIDEIALIFEVCQIDKKAR